MRKDERQSFILHEVNIHNKVFSTELSKMIDVSDDTIRRDIQQLSEEGKVIKFHGGALSPSFSKGNISSNEVYAYQQKKIIAKKTISLIRNGMVVLTTGGTTVLEMAKAIPDDMRATFISGSIPALSEYILHPSIEVIAIGDRISKHSKLAVGADAIARIKELKADLCILGVSAINLQTGVSDNDWEIVQVKKAMIESSKRVVCLAIAEKINTRQPLQVCDIRKVHSLVTELSPHDLLLEPYVRLGIDII